MVWRRWWIVAAALAIASCGGSRSSPGKQDGASDRIAETSGEVPGAPGDTEDGGLTPLDARGDVLGGGDGDDDDAIDASAMDAAGAIDARGPDGSRPVDDGGSDAPPFGGVCRADRIRTARGFSVTLAPLANDDLPAHVTSPALEISERPAHGSASVDQERFAIYTPARGYVGGDRFRYRVLTNDGELGWADVLVEVADEDWFEVGTQLYQASMVAPSRETTVGPDEAGVIIYDLAAGSTLVGSRLADQTWSGTIWPSVGDMARDTIVPGARSTWLHHAGPGDRIAGAAEAQDGTRFGFIQRADGVSEPMAVPGFLETEAYAASGAAQTVGAGRSPSAFGNDLWHAIVVDSSTDPVEVRKIDPVGATTGAWAYGASEDGMTMVGAFGTAAEIRGFTLGPAGQEEVHPPGTAWSRAYDVDSDRRIVGTYGDARGLQRGFVRGAHGTFDHVDLPFALETAIFGCADGGRLSGSAVVPSGFLRGFHAWPLRPGALDQGISAARAPEPENHEISHACGHTMIGPFVDMEATADRDGAPRISTSHTQYNVRLVPFRGRKGGYLRFRSTGAGPFTLHALSWFPLRMSDASGNQLPTRLVERSALCPNIAWFHQYATTDDGNYYVEIGPTDLEMVAVVYERTWPVP